MSSSGKKTTKSSVSKKKSEKVDATKSIMVSDELGMVFTTDDGGETWGAIKMPPGTIGEIVTDAWLEKKETAKQTEEGDKKVWMLTFESVLERLGKLRNSDYGKKHNYFKRVKGVSNEGVWEQLFLISSLVLTYKSYDQAEGFSDVAFEKILSEAKIDWNAYLDEVELKELGDNISSIAQVELEAKQREDAALKQSYGKLWGTW